MDAGPEHLDAAKAKNLTAALRATTDRLFQLVLDSDPDILKATLHNPNLSDDHLLVMLKRRDLPEELPKLIHQRRKKNLSHQLMVALAKNPTTPGSLIRNLLPHLRMFELVDLCFIPGVTADQRLAAERAIIQRLPTTPLGNKITIARRATANVVGELLKEGDPRTLEACLNSSRVKEAAVFQLLNGPASTATTISMIARNSRWNQRPNIRMAILKNRLTPAIWFTIWLPTLPVVLINQLLASRRLSPQQKVLIQAELKNRTKRH